MEYFPFLYKFSPTKVKNSLDFFVLLSLAYALH